MPDAFNSWVDKARAAPIEGEIERRGIKMRCGIERCGPCPKCGGDDRFSINVAKQLFNCRGCGRLSTVVVRRRLGEIPPHVPPDLSVNASEN
jgi:hypothetical protein